MNREFLINITFLISINLLIKPFYIFGIDRTVQNMVGAESYGLYFALFNFTYLLQIINDFGIQNYNNRNIAQHNQLLDKFFPNILILKIILGVIYIFAVFFFAYLAGYTPNVFHLLSILATNQILIALLFYFRSNITGLGMYRTDSILSALDKLLMIIICGSLLWLVPFKNEFKIEWFVFAQTASLFITCIVAFVLVYKHLTRIQFRFNLPFLLVILKQSYPFALVIFLMTLYTRIDGVMIERLLPDGAKEAGIYASAYRLLDAVNMVGFLFAGLLLPMFSKIIKEKKSITELLSFSFQMIWAGAVITAMAVFFFQKEIMELLYIEADAYWGEVLGYLMMTFIAVSGIYIVSTLLTAKGLLMKMNVIFLISIFLNVILNYFLIHEYKASGAAIASVVTQFFVLFSKIFLVVKAFQLSVNYFLVMRIIGFTLAVAITSFYTHQYLPFDWIMNFLLTGLISVLIAFAFRLIQPLLLLGLVKGKDSN